MLYNMKKHLFIALLILLTLPIAYAQNNKTSDKPDAKQGENMKILIAYFSCTGNTRSLAEQIAKASKADLYEIKPKAPYSSADLNWRVNSSRANKENNDPSSRPAISGSVENIEKYNIVFLGYPIWWGQAPKIIYTFLESYDFSGKTIVPFCTSGSSPIGSSASNLHKLCSDKTTWLSGSRFASNTSRSAVVTWIKGLGLNITAE